MESGVCGILRLILPRMIQIKYEQESMFVKHAFKRVPMESAGDSHRSRSARVLQDKALEKIWQKIP
jgi:hypothetical protein